MLRPAAILGALLLWAACNKSDSGGRSNAGPLGATPGATKPGSGSSFSADLAQELGAGSAAVAAGSAAGSDGDRAGSAATAIKAGAESPVKSADAAKPGGTAKPGGDPTKPGGDPTKPGGDPTKPGGDPTKPASAAPPPVAAAPSAARPVAAAPSAALRAGMPSAPEIHGPVKVSAALAAIKLSLLPNWDRDIDEAGTFQYVVRIKGTQNTKTFSFRYGYDDSKAPSDRDQYKKYLQDARLLMGEIRDRQRGAAWFLEGTDASGLPAFRYQVLYGGKRLVCYGSLYKDADSSRLGDDRDQTVIQAKQICETLAL